VPSFNLGIVASGYVDPPFAATGGTVSDFEGYRYHTFTGNGTFSINGAGSKNVEYFAIAGGGGAGSGFYNAFGGMYARSAYGGGGGAGGVHISSVASLSAGDCNIIIGAGGVGGERPEPSSTGYNGSSGSSTTLSGIITHTLSGGGGGTWGIVNPSPAAPGNGGSNVNYSGANGIIPTNPGPTGGTGGGGAGTAGNATDINGGAAVSVFSNSYGAGGNGGIFTQIDNYVYNDLIRIAGANAAANTGSGGVGGSADKGGNGGSGIVVFRYLI